MENLNPKQGEPELTIQWKRHTTRHRPRKNRHDKEWKWHCWRTEIAGVRFQYAKLSTRMWDLNGADSNKPPDELPHAHWEIHSDFGTERAVEFMGYLMPATDDPDQVQEEANRKVRAFMAYRREQLTRAIEQIDTQRVGRQLQLI